MSQIESLHERTEKQLIDSPRTGNRRQIAGALIFNHHDGSACLDAIAAVDFYPADLDRQKPTKRSTT